MQEVNVRIGVTHTAKIAMNEKKRKENEWNRRKILEYRYNISIKFKLANEKALCISSCRMDIVCVRSHSHTNIWNENSHGAELSSTLCRKISCYFREFKDENASHKIRYAIFSGCFCAKISFPLLDIFIYSVGRQKWQSVNPARICVTNMNPLQQRSLILVKRARLVIRISRSSSSSSSKWWRKKKLRISKWR